MNQKVVVGKKRGEHEGLFSYLPSEIMLNILLRLHTRSIMICKCVCKAWLDLLRTPEFVQSHLSNSVPGLLVFNIEEKHSKKCITVEFEDERRCNKVFEFDIPFYRSIHYHPMNISINGLLFLYHNFKYTYKDPTDVFICNPMTREYIKLPPPLPPHPRCDYYTYGFGVSKVSGQYKVVKISNHIDQCQAYTVGTGSWRRIASWEFDDQRHRYGGNIGSFVNGNLHWLLGCRISCFDLETEVFSSFCAPPLGDGDMNSPFLCALGDHLCVCDTLYYHKFGMPSKMPCGLDIWMMKEYGDEKSWTKQFVIKHCYPYEGEGYPVKVMKEDGDILIEWGWGARHLYFYSTERENNHQKLDLSTERYCNSINYNSIIYTPSFVPLKTFAMENVASF